VYWFLKLVLVGPIVRWFTRPLVIGALPDGPVVLTPNHLCEIDSLVLAAALPRRLTFVAKHEYFASGRSGARLYGALCRATGQIPIDRAGAGSADAALAAARAVLDVGGAWVIFPEGTRSPDGSLYRGRTGAMRVALSHGTAKVVPIGIVGTRSVERPGGRGWRRGRVEIRIGDPLDVTHWRPRADQPAAWRETTDALMRAIRNLSHQKYVDRHPTPGEISRRDAE
jgi:1-acyl-sn-glycerol-3-phosphate acyltransferase